MTLAKIPILIVTMIQILILVKLKVKAQTKMLGVRARMTKLGGQNLHEPLMLSILICFLVSLSSFKMKLDGFQVFFTDKVLVVDVTETN